MTEQRATELLYKVEEMRRNVDIKNDLMDMLHELILEAVKSEISDREIIKQCVHQFEPRKVRLG